MHELTTAESNQGEMSLREEYQGNLCVYFSKMCLFYSEWSPTRHWIQGIAAHLHMCAYQTSGVRALRPRTLPSVFAYT